MLCLVSLVLRNGSGAQCATLLLEFPRYLPPKDSFGVFLHMHMHIPNACLEHFSIYAVRKSTILCLAVSISYVILEPQHWPTEFSAKTNTENPIRDVVLAVELHPTRALVLSGSMDGEAYTWDVLTGMWCQREYAGLLHLSIKPANMRLGRVSI